MKLSKLKKIYYKCKYSDILGGHYFDDFKITKQNFESVFDIPVEQDEAIIIEFIKRYRQAQEMGISFTQQDISSQNQISQLSFFDGEKDYASKKDVYKYGIGKDTVIFRREVIYYVHDSNAIVKTQTRYFIDDNFGKTKILSYLIVDEKRFVETYNLHKQEIDERVKQSKYDFLVRSRNLPLPANPKDALKNIGTGILVAAALAALVGTAVVIGEHQEKNFNDHQITLQEDYIQR